MSLVMVMMGAFFSVAGANDLESNESPASLRVVTINVWSGLDYRGTLRFGEYESESRREQRFVALIGQLRELEPDVVFVQEANPVGTYSRRLADSLGFDEVHQVSNAGIKVLGFGIPLNFEEGIAILSRKGLRLRVYDVWKLSGSFGLYGDFMSFNFDEAEFALVSQINVAGKSIFLINLHLSASPTGDSAFIRRALGSLSWAREDRHKLKRAFESISPGAKQRMEEIGTLIDHVSGLPAEVPIILGGDFNSITGSRAMELFERSGLFHDVSLSSPISPLPTWDMQENENIRFSTRFADARGDSLDLQGKISALYDTFPRRIDYLFCSDHFGKGSVTNYRRVIDSTRSGVLPSDHFGVAADISLADFSDSDSDPYAREEERAHVEPLPILSYDTDTGFGYGAKLFLFDLLHSRESLDLVLFNSTKGERWYRLVLSYPDFEWREGKEYPFAIDFTFDYDKWLRNNYFGIGNNSSFAQRKEYTREPMQFSLAVSRGFTHQLVGQLTLTYESIRNSNFETGNSLAVIPSSINSGTSRYASADLSARYDTRNSFINPSGGIVLQGEAEYSPDWSPGNTSFTRFAAWFQYYTVLFYPTTVFAFRLGVQQIEGSNLPVQVYSSIGGTNTLRGYPQDRYLDKADALANTELRFPIFWRIGGVVGLDAGKVWPSLTAMDIRRWATNPVAGLRLYMDNFVVRADLGFGHDGTGFYFNFGHMF